MATHQKQEEPAKPDTGASVIDPFGEHDMITPWSRMVVRYTSLLIYLKTSLYLQIILTNSEIGIHMESQALSLVESITARGMVYSSSFFSCWILSPRIHRSILLSLRRSPLQARHQLFERKWNHQKLYQFVCDLKISFGIMLGLSPITEKYDAIQWDGSAEKCPVQQGIGVHRWRTRSPLLAGSSPSRGGNPRAPSANPKLNTQYFIRKVRNLVGWRNISDEDISYGIQWISKSWKSCTEWTKHRNDLQAIRPCHACLLVTLSITRFRHPFIAWVGSGFNDGITLFSIHFILIQGFILIVPDHMMSCKIVRDP